MKNIHTDILTRVETKSITGDTTTTSNSRVVDTRQPKSYIQPHTNITVPHAKEVLNVFVGVPPEYQAGGSKDMSGTTVGTDGTGMSLSDFEETFPEVVDPIAAAYIAVNGNDSALDEGAALYWSTAIAKELGPDASPEAVQDRMQEHIEFANDAEKVAKFEAENADLIAKSSEEISALTGVTDYAALDHPCGMGQQDPLAQSFYVSEPNGIYVTKVDLYFGSKDDRLPVTCLLYTSPSPRD